MLAVLMAGAARLLISEAPLGVTARHAETLAYIERTLDQLETRRADADAVA